MLALDDERWALLSHAYGDADDVPQMILELRENFESERSNDLFYGYLCHQNSTYSATFAAVPHIVEVAFKENQSIENQTDVAIFCGMVHAERNYDRRYRIASDDKRLVDKLSAEIEDEYSKSIGKITPLLGNLLKSERLDEESRKYLFFSFLALHGQEKLSRMFFQFGALDEFIFDCPSCEKEIYLWAEDGKLVAYRQDPVFIRKFHKEPTKFEVSPVEIDWKSWSGEYSDEQKEKWMLSLADKYDIEPLKHQLPYLFGEMFCPHCGQSIKILDSLID